MLRACAVVSFFVAAPCWANAKVTGIDVRPSSERVDVVVKANQPVTFQSWTRQGPPDLVVDLLDADSEARTLSPGGAIEGITVSQQDIRGTPLTRISLSLKSQLEYDVTARGDEVTISLFVPGRGQLAGTFKETKTTKLAMASDRGVRSDAPKGIIDGSVGRATSEVELAQATTGALQMSYIGFKNSASQSRVFARVNGEAKFSVKKEGDNLLVLEIANTTIPLRNNKNHLDTTFFDSPVKMITPSEVENATPTVRITVEMKQATPYEVKLEGREVVLTFKK